MNKYFHKIKLTLEYCAWICVLIIHLINFISPFWLLPEKRSAQPAQKARVCGKLNTIKE